MASWREADFFRLPQSCVVEIGARARIVFRSPELLWQVLTAKRWELLKAMRGAESLSICEVARRVGRDVKAVHGDVRALLDAGVLNHGANGGVEFPFDAVRVEFMLYPAPKPNRSTRSW